MRESGRNAVPRRRLPAKAPLDVFGDVTPALRVLARRNVGLKQAIAAIGAPHIRRRAGGFEGLFRIIVEQQVSVPSAQAIWRRVGEGLDCIAPETVLRMGPDGLRALGLSTPKARYVTGLAEAVRDGRIDFAALSAADDEAAFAALLALVGVGRWTAGIYLLFCEGRSDIWPPNDVALRRAYEAAAEAPIAQRDLDAMADDWAPYRGVAAHILWTYYAHLRNRTPI